MKQTHYDLVILGSGSTAFVAALRAQELGKTSVMDAGAHVRKARASTAAACRRRTSLKPLVSSTTRETPRNMDRLVLQGRENNCLAALPECGPGADPLRHFRSPA